MFLHPTRQIALSPRSRACTCCTAFGGAVGVDSCCALEHGHGPATSVHSIQYTAKSATVSELTGKCPDSFQTDWKSGSRFSRRRVLSRSFHVNQTGFANPGPSHPPSTQYGRRRIYNPVWPQQPKNFCATVDTPNISQNVICK